MAYQSSRNLHKIRFTTTSTMELHMQTYDHQPPRKTRKLPRGFLSTTIAIVKKTPGGLDHYIVFFPRAVWPVRPRHHDQALSFEFRYFERPHIDCGPTPISIPSALTPLPSGPTAATSPNATASMSSSSLRLSTSSVSRSTPSPTSTSSTGGMVPPPPPIAAPRFIHYHPNTPYLLHVARGGSLGAHDMLYYLERLFGHCLIDRTGTLTRRSPVKILRPLAPKLPDFNLSIDKICDARARHIIARAEREHRKIAVLWSGGIDSTSVAVSLLRNVPEANWKSIHILYTDRSKEENETFYEWLRVHTTMNYLGETINEIYRPLADSQSSSVFLPLIVTGELGDQIFGSMLAEYFYNTETTFKSKTNNKKQQSQPTPTRSTSSVTNERSLRNSCSVGGGKRSTATSGTHARVTAATSMMSSMMSSMLTKDDDLESEEEERGRLISKASSFMRGKHNQAWRKFFNDFLKHYKIVPPKAAPLMIAYIEPQIKKSPVPIVNAYDLLWWLNFSMKWQHVSLRIPLLMEYTGEAQSTLRMNRTVNFFDTDDFEQWSYHNHHLKMYDRSDWATYKVRFIWFLNYSLFHSPSFLVIADHHLTLYISGGGGVNI